MLKSHPISEGNQYKNRKIANWLEYYRSLVNRGAITFWFDRGIEEVWFYKKTHPTCRGLDKTFSDEALQACLMLRAVYKLPLRAMEGFVNSLFGLLGLPLKCPGYTLFSKGRGRRRGSRYPVVVSDRAGSGTFDSNVSLVPGYLALVFRLAARTTLEREFKRVIERSFVGDFFYLLTI